MISLGIDIGSRNTKIVLYDTVHSTILHSAYQSTDVSPLKTVDELLNAAYATLLINYCDLNAIGVTGYGRKLYPEASSVLSEITCHAAACLKLFPAA
ncbi:MAG: BadF/BadG/BcrA/BcrD ATPase family protein, partial [Candidatus Cloacimonas sp.]|nr:BadF/BadG/BcrA/BcrD ATPase family protein [Candidatus Cloacimonas sp.]